MPCDWELGVLTAGPPRKSLSVMFIVCLIQLEDKRPEGRNLYLFALLCTFLYPTSVSQAWDIGTTQ